MTPENKNKLLTVEDLHTSFYTKKGEVKAVDGVSFSAAKGEIIGLVGESGSGKSITCLSIMGLVPQPSGRVTSGRIIFKNENLLEKSKEEMRRLRGDRISMILQDPMVALNPLLTVGYQLGECFKFHDKAKGSIKEKCIQLLKKVKVPAPEARLNFYPFQLSGGISQRVLISAGIANNPDLLIADEPTTALDVTVQAEILDLIARLQEEKRMAMILISHDLDVVAGRTNETAVMYAGRIVEQAATNELYDSIHMPYTRALMDAIPRLADPPHTRLQTIGGYPPDLIDLPSGCRFAPRCPGAAERCQHQEPTLKPINGQSHRVACWYPLNIR